MYHETTCDSKCWPKINIQTNSIGIDEICAQEIERNPNWLECSKLSNPRTMQSTFQLNVAHMNDRGPDEEQINKIPESIQRKFDGIRKSSVFIEITEFQLNLMIVNVNLHCEQYASFAV